MTDLIYPSVDFSTLGSLGDVYRQAQQQAQIDAVRQQIRDNPNMDLGQAARSFIGAGGTQEGATLANLWNQQQQRALQERQVKIAEKAAEEKPQTQKIVDPVTGMERLVTIQPFGRGATYLNPGEPGSAPGTGSAPVRPPGIPDTADVPTYRKHMGEEAAKNQQEAVASAKSAASAQPLIDELLASYKDAVKAGAVGPVVGSTPGRYAATGMAVLGNATGLGSQSEALEAARQRYDKAKSALQLHANAFKGQGAVSNYERSLASAQYPDLTALHPEDQIAILENMASEGRRTAEAGKMSPLSQTPAVNELLTRSPITPGTQTPAPPPNQGQPPAQGQPQQAKPPQFPDAKMGKKPDGSPGWFIQRNGKTYLVE
jgi:hypothetical protein